MKKIILFILVISIISTKWVFGQVSNEKIQTIPEITTLLDSNKKDLGSAPFDPLKLSAGMEYTINCKGYEPAKFIMLPEKKGIKFPESLRDCYPCLVEFNQHPLADDFIPAGKIKLRKKLPSHNHSIMIAITTPEIKMDQEDVVANINGHKIKFRNEDIHLTMGYPENLINPTIKGFNNTYLDAYDIDANKSEKTRMFKPKIIVKPVIKKLEYRLNGRFLRDYTGPAILQCEWQFFFINDSSKMIGKTTTNSSFYRTGKDYNLPMHELMYEASRDLVSNDTLYSFLEKLQSKFLESNYLKPTIITKAKLPTFSSQKEMLKFISLNVVTVENENGFGSGVIIDPSGIVLTNHHVVIDDTIEIKVRIKDKDELLNATVISKNSDYDLALLKLPAGKYSFISLSTDDSLETGDVVFAIGTPLDKSLGQSVTKGIISGFREFNGIKFIQTDVSINAGNSGGALVNDEGKFIGISTMKIAGKGIEGLGFCIPASTIIKGLNLK